MSGGTPQPDNAVGLHERGLLRVGMKADLNVIDYDRLGAAQSGGCL